MNIVWMIILFIAVVYGAIFGRGEEMTFSMLSSGETAITLCLSLAGAYALWCGVLKVMEKSGITHKLSTLLKPAMRLFPGIKRGSKAQDAITANLAANMLGLGNAATPAGIEAMRQMRAVSGDGDRASDAMCMFLVINASSIQLVPTTIISLRAAAGAVNPMDILVPSLIATACSTICAIVCMKLYFGWEGLRRG